MPLYEADLFYTYASQHCVNRWNYISGTIPAGQLGAFALASTMGFIPTGTPPLFEAASIARGIQGNVSNDVTFEQILVKNVYDPTDFYDAGFPPTTVGEQTGQSLAPFIAVGFVSSVISRAIKRGTKRFAGLTVAQTDNDGTLDATALAAFNDLATKMGAVITFTDGSGTSSFTPTIVSKEKYTTPRGKTAYKYYPTLTEQLAHVAEGVTWTVYPDVRSQVSRQYGRGQ